MLRKTRWRPFVLAWEQGADAIECDVRMSKDGQIVVIHDADTQRTAGVNRLVADQTLDELRQLDFGGWKGQPFVGERSQPSRNFCNCPARQTQLHRSQDAAPRSWPN